MVNRRIASLEARDTKMTYISTLCYSYHRPSIKDPKLLDKADLTHHWNVLREARYDAAGAYLLTVAKVKADECPPVRKEHTLRHSEQ